MVCIFIMYALSFLYSLYIFQILYLFTLERHLVIFNMPFKLMKPKRNFQNVSLQLDLLP